MKKLFVFLLLLILLPFISYAQIWEGNGGEFIQEGIGFGSNGSGGGGWIPEPLDPNMTHYTISFKDDNETTSLFSPIELNENTVVNLSVFVPTRSEGYDFSHWEDSNGDTVTSVTMTADTTVYAVWTAHTHSITWQITDYSKNPVATYTSVDNNIAYGSIIVASSTPATPSGFEFSGWDNPSTMPDYNLTVNGRIEQLSIVFKLSEIDDSLNPSRYPITYEGNIASYQPITYSNGVASMGDWEDWINDHFTPVMLKSDGTVDYELSRTNQNYKADGVTPSDVGNVNYDGNAMLKIKKFYLYCTTESEGIGGATHNVHTIRISDTKPNNNYTCWGFVDANGVEQDYAYYALYSCYVDSNSKLRSLSGITLSSSAGGNHLKHYSDIVTAAKANGNGWNISNLALENNIGLVMMLLYKDTNPMFVAQEIGSGSTYFNYRQDMSVYQVTGTRNADGGFPYAFYDQKVKALWLESYWRSYDTAQAETWVNGLGSLKHPNPDSTGGLNQFLAYYRVKEPFDFTDLSSWNLMSDIETYAYVSASQAPHRLTFFNNILFCKDFYQRGGAVSTNDFDKHIGGGEISGALARYQLSDEILPAKMGGRPMGVGDKYCDAPHWLSYMMYGNSTQGSSQKFAYGSGRLTYLPQSN